MVALLALVKKVKVFRILMMGYMLCDFIEHIQMAGQRHVLL